MTDQQAVPALVEHVESAQLNRTGAPRLASLDVTRALALVGVVILNYHGFLNGGNDGVRRSFAERVFDPFQGPLSTRFAATFVMVAGMGVTLMTNRSRLSKQSAAIRDDRWRLARRGLLLYAGGFVFEWIWPGTILFFYGALFMVAALLFTLRLRWIAMIGATSALVAAAVAWYRFEHGLNGHDVSWLDPGITSPRNLLFRTFIGYTHPLFPWLAFLCVGIILGRLLPTTSQLRRTLVLGGSALLAGTYAMSHFGVALANNSAVAAVAVNRPFAPLGTSGRRWELLLSTRPFDRGLLYTIGTVGSSLIAFCAISMLVDRYPNAWPTRRLQHAGQMTLTIYLCHGLFFNLVVNWLHWVTSTGLDTALILSLTFWVGAITLGSIWHSKLGTGPFERIYRSFGG